MIVNDYRYTNPSISWEKELLVAGLHTVGGTLAVNLLSSSLTSPQGVLYGAVSYGVGKAIQLGIEHGIEPCVYADSKILTVINTVKYTTSFFCSVFVANFFEPSAPFELAACSWGLAATVPLATLCFYQGYQSCSKSFAHSGHENRIVAIDIL